MMNISAEDVKKAIDTKEQVILLDVRSPGEVALGKIAGAINVPIDEIEQRIEQVIPDKNVTVYVYCLSATRSPIAVGIMETLGYTKVYNMEHGLLAWRVLRFPTV